MTTDRLIEEALTSVGDGNIYNGPRYLVTIMQSLIKMGKIKKANEVTDKAIAAALINKAGDPYNCAYEFVDIFDALIQQRKTEQAQKIADTLLVVAQKNLESGPQTTALSFAVKVLLTTGKTNEALSAAQLITFPYQKIEAFGIIAESISKHNNKKMAKKVISEGLAFFHKQSFRAMEQLYLITPFVAALHGL